MSTVLQQHCLKAYSVLVQRKESGEVPPGRDDSVLSRFLTADLNTIEVDTFH